MKSVNLSSTNVEFKFGRSDADTVALMDETTRVLREHGGTYTAARRIARERLAAKAKGAAKPATGKPATAAANARALAVGKSNHNASAGMQNPRRNIMSNKTERPDKELARRAAEIMRAEGCDILTAQHRVLAQDPDLKERYRQQLVSGAA